MKKFCRGATRGRPCDVTIHIVACVFTGKGGHRSRPLRPVGARPVPALSGKNACHDMNGDIARAPTGGAPTELFHPQWIAAGSWKPGGECGESKPTTKRPRRHISLR